MTRLFELRKHEADGELLAIVDLDKVCLVRIKQEVGHHYQRILIRFVDGHETDDLVPPGGAQAFLEAYRHYLGEHSGS